MAVLFAGSLMATEVTFSYADYKGQGTSGSGSEYTMVKTDVSITSSKFYGNTSNGQFFANGTVKFIPAAGVTISKVVLTATSTSYNGYQSSGNPTVTTGTLSKNNSVVTWTGSASSEFTLTNDKQIRWTTIVVTYEAAATPPAPTTKTFYCKMEYDWWTADGAAIGAFAWKENGEANADFPGIRMTPVPGADYVWTIDIDTVKYDQIIFARVNGSGDIANWGAQTADLAIPLDDNNLYTITSTSAVWDGGSGNKVTGTWSQYAPPALVTMYCVNKLAWTTVNGFVWPTTGSAPAAWPGEAMTKGSKALGYDVYSYTFPETYENIIFNDGTDQTADLVWAADKPYFVPGAKNAQNKYEGTWYASLEGKRKSGLLFPSVAACAAYWMEFSSNMADK